VVVCSFLCGGGVFLFFYSPPPPRGAPPPPRPPPPRPAFVWVAMGRVVARHPPALWQRDGGRALLHDKQLFGRTGKWWRQSLTWAHPSPTRHFVSPNATVGSSRESYGRHGASVRQQPIVPLSCLTVNRRYGVTVKLAAACSPVLRHCPDFYDWHWFVPPARPLGQRRYRLGRRHLDWELHTADPAGPAVQWRAGRSDGLMRPPCLRMGRSGTLRCPARPAR
ncbi:hypothetical protein ABID95_007441, partial [Streptomyces atratus]